MALSKSQALRRVRILINTLKQTHSTCDYVFANDIDNFADELQKLEAECASMIDNVMASRYLNHNVRTRNERISEILSSVEESPLSSLPRKRRTG